MTAPAELARQILVRHRAPGFLRLEVPAALCAPAAVARIESGLLTLAGVQSAAVDVAWRRISVRFDEAQVAAPQVARHLFGLLDGLPAEAPAEEAPAAVAPEAAGNDLYARAGNVFANFTAPLREAINRPQPPDSLAGKLQPLLASALTEKAITNFLNDLTAFYLVKVHWDLISKRWLKTPLAYSNAWMTTFYLVFLLIRYRKSNK
jgi:hypothetical protein